MNNKAKYFITVIVITSFLLEGALRVLGYRPGYLGKFEGIIHVDSLIVYQNYYTDKFGVIKYSAWVTDSLRKYFDWTGGRVTDKRTGSVVQDWDNIFYNYTSYKRLQHQGKIDVNWKVKLLLGYFEANEDWDSEFTRAYSEIIRKPNLSNLEKAIVDYVAKPFNNDGFRSIEFKVHDTSNTRILLIGDSFVYGMAARPFFNSYSDILLARGYEVYNVGIPGTDPAQYAALAKEYIPLLKPDMVIVNFCEGNDLMMYPRRAEKGKPIEHATNGGFFGSSPLGEYLPASEAYEYYHSLNEIPDKTSNIINKLCSYSSITSRIWGILYKQGLFTHPERERYYQSIVFDVDKAIGFTKQHFDTIDSICKSNNAEYVVVVIPNEAADYNDSTDNIKINKRLADKLFLNNYCNPINTFKREDFYVDHHFNNSGSLKFANLIDSIIHRSFHSYN